MASFNFKTVDELLQYADPSNPSTSVIRYNSNNPKTLTSPSALDSVWLEPLVQALNKCNIKCENTGVYDKEMKQAIIDFQKQYMPDKFYYTTAKGAPTLPGEINDATVQRIFAEANLASPDDIPVETQDKNNVADEDVKSNSPHYTSFFDTDNTKQFRQNHKNIRIEIGSTGLVKTIYDVVMRGVGVEVDTSGNPISETYEFIARDITETDEANDADNYINNNGTSPSDVKYRFNFH